MPIIETIHSINHSIVPITSKNSKTICTYLLSPKQQILYSSVILNKYVNITLESGQNNPAFTCIKFNLRHR